MHSCGGSVRIFLLTSVMPSRSSSSYCTMRVGFRFINAFSAASVFRLSEMIFILDSCMMSLRSDTAQSLRFSCLKMCRIIKSSIIVRFAESCLGLSARLMIMGSL